MYFYVNIPFIIGFVLVAFTPYIRLRQREKQMNLKLYLTLLFAGSLCILWGAILDNNWIILAFDAGLFIAVTYDMIRAYSGKLTSYEKKRVENVLKVEDEQEQAKRAAPHFVDTEHNDLV